MFQFPAKAANRHHPHSEITQPAMDSRSSDTASHDVNVGQDRLAHAKNFAAKLSDSRLREMAQAYRKRWTPAHRAEKAKIIQSIKPWKRSTGPKSGPKRKGAGFRKQALNATLRQHRWFLQSQQPRFGFRKSAAGLGITSTAALYLLLSVEGAEIWAFPDVTERNNR